MECEDSQKAPYIWAGESRDFFINAPKSPLAEHYLLLTPNKAPRAAFLQGQASAPEGCSAPVHGLLLPGAELLPGLFVGFYPPYFFLLGCSALFMLTVVHPCKGTMLGAGRDRGQSWWGARGNDLSFRDKSTLSNGNGLFILAWQSAHLKYED